MIRQTMITEYVAFRNLEEKLYLNINTKCKWKNQCNKYWTL